MLILFYLFDKKLYMKVDIIMKNIHASVECFYLFLFISFHKCSDSNDCNLTSQFDYNDFRRHEQLWLLF